MTTVDPPVFPRHLFALHLVAAVGHVVAVAMAAPGLVAASVGLFHLCWLSWTLRALVSRDRTSTSEVRRRVRRGGVAK